MSEGDWDHVTVIRKSGAKGNGKSASALASAARTGAQVQTQAKYHGAGQNKSGGLDAARLDRETEELTHKSVGKNVGVCIQKGRAAKGWKQKDLAAQVGVKVQEITDMEQGKGIPNSQLLQKVERKIGIKLQGKNIGEPLSQGGGKKKK